MDLARLRPLLAELPSHMRDVVELHLLGQDARIEELEKLVQNQAQTLNNQVQLINDQTQLIKDLRVRLNQNSGNSSNPPSSDRPNRKPRNKHASGKKPNRKPGGQKGHEGSTLKMVASESLSASQIQDHFPESCEQCGRNLPQQSEGFGRRQVFDIPPVKIEVNEHRAHTVCCGHCHCSTTADFPSEATNHAVYGPNLRSWVVYCMTYQLLPYERMAELISDFLGHPISQGTLDNMLCEASAQLADFCDQSRAHLCNEPVVGFDESGMRCGGHTRYVHVARSETHTLFRAGRRDKATIDQMGVLPAYKGISIHDRYSAYFGYMDSQHASCHAHISRELQAAIEQTGEYWAHELQKLLLQINKNREKAKAAGKSAFSPSTLYRNRQRYRLLVEMGQKLHPPKPPVPGKKGRPKQSKTHNLLRFLDEQEASVLLFMLDFDVPFTNNGAERDIRMLKLRQKISGFFHSLETSDRFLRIRALISTARKQGFSAYQACMALFSPDPQRFVAQLF